MVTAVITTHRREPELVARALNSILSQTYRDIEIIIVDDSPSDYERRDEVKQLAENSGANVRYIRHERCSGACAARNTGLKAASGEFIGYLDDDDEWLPTKIEKQLQGFTSESIGFVYCRYRMLASDESEVKSNRSGMESGYIFNKLLFKNIVGSTSFPLIRKSALDEIGGFDTELPSSQDLDVWMRLSRDHEANYIDEALGIYHYHDGEQITTNPKKKIAGMERIIEKNLPDLQAEKKAYSCRLLALANYYALDKRLPTAFRKWLKAVSLNPSAVGTNLRSLLVSIKWRIVYAG